MRACAMWTTPWVPRDTEVILDTSALSDADWRIWVHSDPDPPPRDTVLVLVHPARMADLKMEAEPLDLVGAGDRYDVNGVRIARRILERRCHDDEDLRRRLRWDR